MDVVATTYPYRTGSFHNLAARVVSGGGFTDRPGGLYRPDATAWAILSLNGERTGGDLINPARSRLARDQKDDGRISISVDHPEAFWPTPMAVLAWQGSVGHRENQQRAIQFLLRTTGKHFEKDPTNPVGHDTALKGWPWIEDTHSWVEPTVLSILALDNCGYGDHPRVQEAIRLVMDRQLPHGGWNYGNTTVFGQELHPAPESTGAALHALGGRVPREQIQRSLDYLTGQVMKLRTPLALGWSLLGLGSWGMLPAQASQLVEKCLARQDRYGAYETTALCVLLLSVSAPAGFARVGSRE